MRIVIGAETRTLTKHSANNLLKEILVASKWTDNGTNEREKHKQQKLQRLSNVQHKPNGDGKVMIETR